MKYPRTEYEMTEEDEKQLLAAMVPTPCIMIGGVVGPSLQDKANIAWADLGRRMGFDFMTVRPIPGKNQRCFTAIPSETEEQRACRLAEERRGIVAKKIKDLNEKITALENERYELLAEQGPEPL